MTEYARESKKYKKEKYSADGEIEIRERKRESERERARAVRLLITKGFREPQRFGCTLVVLQTLVRYVGSPLYIKTKIKKRKNTHIIYFDMFRLYFSVGFTTFVVFPSLGIEDSNDFFQFSSRERIVFIQMTKIISWVWAANHKETYFFRFRGIIGIW